MTHIDKLKSTVESRWFHNLIITIIIINGVVLGLQTINDLTVSSMQILDMIDSICLALFVFELTLKIIIYC